MIDPSTTSPDDDPTAKHARDLVATAMATSPARPWLHTARNMTPAEVDDLVEYLARSLASAIGSAPSIAHDDDAMADAQLTAIGLLEAHAAGDLDAAAALLPDDVRGTHAAVTVLGQLVTRVLVDDLDEMRSRLSDYRAHALELKGRDQ